MLLIIARRQRGPSPVPRPKHAAGTRRSSLIVEPPQCSLPTLWTRSHMGESHQGREFRCLRLSPSPIQAGQEQNKIFPRTLGRSFIFKQDPVEEEDLPSVYRHRCRPQPPQFSQGSEPGASILLGLRSGAVPSLGQAGTAQGTRAGPGTVSVTHRKGMRTGRINTNTYPSTWISSWRKEKTPGG